MSKHILSLMTLLVTFFSQSLAGQQPSTNTLASATATSNQASVPETGQAAPPTPKQTQEKKDGVVRISVTLVQVDVTVTDRKGRPVTDLKAEDFELFQNTRPQHITNFFLPIKKLGAYQLRAAVRDQQTKKLGSANQFIEIPDTKKGRLALSGLIVRGSAPESPSPSAEQLVSRQEGKVAEPDPQASPAVRRFSRGQVVEYAYVIYGAKPDKATGSPDLPTRLRLYRDGQLVYDGNLRPFDPRSQTDFKQLIAGGSVSLGKDLTPGDYALQVIVVDKLAKEKERVTTGWIDFEIVR